MSRPIVFALLLSIVGLLAYRLFNVVNKDSDIDIEIAKKVLKSRESYAKAAQIFRGDLSEKSSIKIPSQVNFEPAAPLTFPPSMSLKLQIAFQKQPFEFGVDLEQEFKTYTNELLAVPFSENLTDRLQVLKILRRLNSSEQLRFINFILRQLEVSFDPKVSDDWLQLQKESLISLKVLTPSFEQRNTFWDRYKASLPDEVQSNESLFLSLANTFLSEN